MFWSDRIELLTDLYQLTMLNSYRRERMNETAVFEFFVRRMPPHRNFLIAAGLEQLLDYLSTWRFGKDEIDWLVAAGHCDRECADYLANLRFQGDVDAMPEGTPFFADEPVVRITAPIAQAQLIESRLINILHYQILIASKAARCVLAAAGKRLIDFGMRRAHGAEAALFAARASYLAGFDGTATVLAEREYGVPTFGTMAHSYVQAHRSESEAFVAFARNHPENCTLLIDTYDTVRGAERVVALIPQLRAMGVAVRAVRLDSGDLDALSRSVRSRFDVAGFNDIQIFASGGLDEMSVAALRKNGAPIDGFGVGTALTVASDAPALDCA
ncbi:MAG: nicotinate phosphoribosyltransferase [Spongiibacteraceae bacterium]